MRCAKVVLVGLLMMSVSACSTSFDNSKYYIPSFRPDIEPIPVCPYREALVDVGIDWVVALNGPQGVKGCGPMKESYVSIAAGRTLNPSWRAWDGGGVMAGTNYSMRTLFPEDREKEREEKARFMASAYYAPVEVEEASSFKNNDMEWEHSFMREITRYPLGDGLGTNPPPGPPRLQRLRDVYIYKHPEGWWLRVQANFHPEMENYPEILASRRDTLRQVVASIRIEPKDPSRVSCRTDDKGYESCRYRWP
jgi:hypothetical protein